ncbi:MAG: GAF domain-containing protein [Rhodoferax sp.]|uniref:GAF domain-containing protein n=1 Tax=Rhodoferax sp. TaxID=50421 RepID=UPI0026214FA7|nr:HD domain-containing phosphohydrolase [Rhodoferax sp.]MDD5336526.1 GAF domain-containing protein [Rhodoferax sp.]
MTVVDGAGLVLARYPNAEQWAGKSAAGLPLWQSIRAKGAEGTQEDIGLDGLRRVVGFVPLHQTASGQAYLLVSTPKDVVVRPAERAFVASLLIALTLLVLTFSAVWLGSESLFVRRLAALTRAAKELGKGNLTARVALDADDEIGQMAQSFDRMADTLQTKEAQLSRTVRALRVLSAGNHAMLHARRGEQQLIEEMCQAIGESGGYGLAWVGYAENDPQQSIRPVAHWGSVVDGYFENVKLTWSEAQSGQAPAGRAIRSDQPAVAQSIEKETGPQPWQDFTLRSGCGACLALPLRLDQQVIGVLNICAREPDTFSDEEVELLSEAAADLSFGIASQRAELERARMQRTLKTAEERFRAAVEASLDALFILKSVRGEDGRIVDFEFTDINAHAEVMLSMARAKVVGQLLCQLLPVMRSNGFFAKCADVTTSGMALDEEFPLDTPEIKAKWLRHQVVRVDDGCAVFARDITRAKESGARLKESEERLRLATQAAHMGAWTWDTKNERFSWSEGIGPVFGLPAGEGFSSTEALIKAIHPADRETVARAVSEGRKRGVPFHGEFRTTWPDGTVHWVQGQSQFIRDGIDGPVRAVGIAMDITERKQRELTLTQTSRALRTLSACNEALTHAVTEMELLNAICQLAVESGGYCMASVRYAQQDAAKTVRVVAHHGSEEGYLESTNVTWADTEQGRGPTGTAIRTGTTQVNQNMLTNPHMAPWREEALAHGFQSSIAMPLKQPSGTLGALTLYARECDAFDEDEVQLLEKLADDLAFGITTLRTRIERDRMAYTHQHHEEILRKSLEESIQAIADTLEMRDPYTAGHQKRTARLAVAIASELGLPKDEVHGIHLAASIHDLGKIQVPAEILSKPSRLSDIEYMLIKTHAQAGYDILKGIEFPWPIANIVLQHHEKLDGSGYPQGLKGKQILLGACIIAVADVMEAMASHRPYRPSLGTEVALQEIERGRGTVYDAAVVDACRSLFRERRFAFQTDS